jgi:hypothetical protein
MPGVVEIPALLAEAAMIMMPALVEVPILGRLLILIAGGHANEGKAIESLEEQAQKKKTERKTRIEKNARYVIKASKAMECVEKNIMNGNFLLAIGRGIANAFLGRTDFAPDVLVERIFECIEQNVLRQDTPRVKKEKKYWGRPSRGHGHGRKG